jgi:hypothetical protein
MEDLSRFSLEISRIDVVFSMDPKYACMYDEAENGTFWHSRNFLK